MHPLDLVHSFSHEFLHPWRCQKASHLGKKWEKSQPWNTLRDHITSLVQYNRVCPVGFSSLLFESMGLNVSKKIFAKEAQYKWCEKVERNGMWLSCTAIHNHWLGIETANRLIHVAILTHKRQLLKKEENECVFFSAVTTKVYGHTHAQ